MRSNVDEISKRGEKLEELETRSGRLEDLVSFKILRIAIQASDLGKGLDYNDYFKLMTENHVS